MHVLGKQPVAPPHGCRRGRDTRRRCCVVVAAADEALCRDKVSAPKDLRGESGTTCVVNFKGADGRVLPVEMPEVCVCVEGVASTWQTPRRVYCRLASALAHICGNTHVTSVPGSVCPRRHPQDMYILNAAEKAGIDLPATCRGGICGRVSSCLCSVFQRSLSARLCCSPWLLQGVCWSGDVRQSGPERRAWQDLSVCHWRAH